MKVCDYCNSIVSDDATVCPNCSAALFSKQCDTCGAKYKGATFPQMHATQKWRPRTSRSRTSGYCTRPNLLILH